MSSCGMSSQGEGLVVDPQHETFPPIKFLEGGLLGYSGVLNSACNRELNQAAMPVATVSC